VREPNGRGYSVGGLVLVLAAAQACAVDDRASPGVSEGPDRRGVDPENRAPVGSAGGGSPGAGGSDVGSRGSDGGAGGSGADGSAGAAAATNGGSGSMGGPSSGGTNSDVTASASPPAALPSAACGEQLLANGDFDAGRTGWQETWDVRETVIGRSDPLLAATGVTPQSGEYLAWLGGVANGEFGEKYRSGLSQMVTFPEATVSLTFSGYVWVEQPELGVTPTSDWMVIELLDPLVAEGVYDDLWQIDIWNEENVTTGWVEFSYVQTMQMDRFRGRTLPIVADSRPDGNGTMSVFLDSLRLVARCE
jgi:hypothetical protein